MMEELVREVVQIMDNYGVDQNEIIKIVEAFENFIDRQPTVDVRPDIKGEWILEKHRRPIYYCSVCGQYQVESIVAIALGQWKFCPNCGANMRNEEKSNNYKNIKELL